MPKTKVSPQNHQPGMMMVMTFVVMSIVNAVVIYLANSLYPQQVVLGTISITPTWALILSSLAIGVLTTFAMPFLRWVEAMRNHVWSPAEMMGLYLVINFLSVWVVTRFADLLGLGVASWMVVLLLAIALDIVQGLAVMCMDKMKSK